MKKTFVSIILIMLVTLLPSIFADAAKLYYNDEYHDYYAGPIRLVVNGKELTDLPMQPVVINDYTMVPVREVFEELGSEVVWHDDTCRVELIDNGISIFVKIGDRNTIVDRIIVPIAEPQPLPMLIGNSPELLKTMVPVRFVAEKLGYSVSWEDATRTVFIDEENEDELIMGDAEDNTQDEESVENEDKEDSDEDKPDENVMPEETGVFGTVTAESDDEYDYIYIATRYGISPKVTRYKDPERIVFDFNNASFIKAGDTVNVGGNCVEDVRYANREGFARLVLDVNCDTQVLILSHEKGILIRANESDNTELVYDAFAQRVYFDKTYVGNGKAVQNGYSVTFTNLKLEEQKITVDDGIIYEIIVTNSAQGCTVTVDGSKKLHYTAEKGFYKTDAPVVDVIPSKPDREKPLVVIDAGHGGNDPGAVGYDKNGKAVAYESHINLSIALMVGEKLEAQGIDVIYTRKKDTYIALSERSDISNESECDMFVSIHCNSIENGEINGTQVYYHPVSETGTELAENIYDKLVEKTNLAPKKTQNGSHLYVIRTTTSPAVLVETAFISNESDRKFLQSSQGQGKIAAAIAEGILETINK